MAGIQARVKKLGIPNILSILRIVIIPVFVYVFLSSARYTKMTGSDEAFSMGRLIAAGILVFSGITDIVDGFIARKFNMVTELGRVLDPLADKLTQAAACVCLVIWSVSAGLMAPMYLLAIFVLKETVMISAGAFIIKKGKKMIPSRWFGKLSTVVFYVVMISIIAFHLTELEINVLICISLAFMVFAFIMYIRIFSMSQLRHLRKN